jgi:uncharacterized membrane protein YeaQ/YmgE (transglycosylase-associated protein family)
MLEELFNLVKNAAGSSVINNPDVPNDKNNDVVAEATSTVASGLRNIVAGGGVGSLVSLFNKKDDNQQSGGLMSNPIVAMMVGHFASKLMNKFNMSGTQASSVSSSLIPNVINSLVNKSNDQSSGFSLENLLNSITGGKAAEVASSGNNEGGGLSNILNSLGGGGENGGGLMDVITKLASGAQSEQQKNGGGGLMDLIKGFIK